MAKKKATNKSKKKKKKKKASPAEKPVGKKAVAAKMPAQGNAAVAFALPAAAIAGKLTCTGFKLTIAQDPGHAFEVTALAFGPIVGGKRKSGGMSYKVINKDKPELVKALLRNIAEKWPNFDWQFTLDDNDVLTDVG